MNADSRGLEERNSHKEAQEAQKEEFGRIPFCAFCASLWLIPLSHPRLSAFIRG